MGCNSSKRVDIRESRKRINTDASASDLGQQEWEGRQQQTMRSSMAVSIPDARGGSGMDSGLAGSAPLGTSWQDRRVLEDEMYRRIIDSAQGMVIDVDASRLETSTDEDRMARVFAGLRNSRLGPDALIRKSVTANEVPPRTVLRRLTCPSIDLGDVTWMRDSLDAVSVASELRVVSPEGGIWSNLEPLQA